jgi:hypothetical protein
VDKKKVGKSDVEEAKKQSGGSAVVQGICYGGDDGVLMFQTAKTPAPAWANVVKKIAARDAGMSVKAEFVLGGEPEEGAGEEPPSDEARFRERLERCERQMAEVEKMAPERATPLRAMLNLARKRDQEKNYKAGMGVLAELGTRLEAALRAPVPPVAPPAPPTDGNPEALFASRLKQLFPQIKDALATKSPGADEAKLRASEASVFARKGDYTQANAMLDKVATLLKSTAIPPAPPPPEMAPDARFATRLKQLFPKIKDAVAAKAPGGEEAKLRASEASVFARKGDYTQANAMLDKVETLLKSSAIPPAPPPPPEMAPDARFATRLKQLFPQIKDALAAKSPGADEAKLRASEASAFARKGDYAQANALLDKVAALLKAAPTSKAQPGETTATPKEPTTSAINFAIQKSRFKWDAATKQAQTEIANFQQTALAKAKDDPALALVTEVVKRYDEAKTAFDSSLSDKLDEALNAGDPDKRRDLNRQAGQMIKEYQSYVQGDPLLKELQTNPFVKMSFPEKMNEVLAELAGHLGV